MKTYDVTKKRILFLGINFKPELTGIGKYTGEMADWLVSHDYECNVVTSFPYYPDWKVQKPYRGLFYKKERDKRERLCIYRCPLYVPKQPSGLKRILQEMTFFFTSFFVICWLLFKPAHDRIFCMAPPFHLAFLAMFYRFFKGGKIIYHVQDLQIEAARDLKVIKVQAVFKLLFALEKFIMKRVDFISTISTGMRSKIETKIERKVLLFPNWVDTNSFYPLEDKAFLRSKWGFLPEEKLVLYSGSIGEKQGLESLITIADGLRNNTQIKFIICGNGPYKDKLMNLVTERILPNFLFLPLQPLSLFNELLNIADVHLILQKRNACDLVMPSKLSPILSVGGLALITAETDSSLCQLINQYAMGVVISCENEGLLGKAILHCCEQDYSAMNSNGRSYAEKFLNRDFVIEQMMLQVQAPDVKEEIAVIDEPPISYRPVQSTYVQHASANANAIDMSKLNQVK